MYDYIMDKREFLAATVGATVSLAGCSSSDDDTGGNADSSESDTSTDDSTPEETEARNKEWREFDRPDDWPDHPRFIANPDVDGPGGDATMALEMKNSEQSSTGFDSLVLDLQELVLINTDGERTVIPVDRTVDFYDYEYGDRLLTVFDAAIPSGTYSAIEIHQEAIEITHAEQGDVTDEFTEQTISTDSFGFDDDTFEVGANSQIIFNITYNTEDPPDNMLQNQDSPKFNSFEPGFDITDPFNLFNYRLT